MSCQVGNPPNHCGCVWGWAGMTGMMLYHLQAGTQPVHHSCCSVGCGRDAAHGRLPAHGRRAGLGLPACRRRARTPARGAGLGWPCGQVPGAGRCPARRACRWHAGPASGAAPAGCSGQVTRQPRRAATGRAAACGRGVSSGGAAPCSCWRGREGRGAPWRRAPWTARRLAAHQRRRCHKRAPACARRGGPRRPAASLHRARAAYGGHGGEGGVVHGAAAGDAGRAYAHARAAGVARCVVSHTLRFGRYVTALRSVLLGVMHAWCLACCLVYANSESAQCICG